MQKKTCYLQLIKIIFEVKTGINQFISPVVILTRTIHVRIIQTKSFVFGKKFKCIKFKKAII